MQLKVVVERQQERIGVLEVDNSQLKVDNSQLKVVVNRQQERIERQQERIGVLEVETKQLNEVVAEQVGVSPSCCCTVFQLVCGPLSWCVAH